MIKKDTSFKKKYTDRQSAEQKEHWKGKHKTFKKGLVEKNDFLKLFKQKTAGSNEQETFILLHEKQVGFEEAQFPECLIEMMQDDDVDTD